ncbi:MAG TPA: hypothetical protein PLV31_04795, partial [Gammaproteobacteria bacterium]|nr:hypothetical protein [Gammaproteobacteria bacterium]
VLLNLHGWERKMLIRDTVTAQERLSGLQPKYTKNRLFNRRGKCNQKAKNIRNVAKIHNYSSEIRE